MRQGAKLSWNGELICVCMRQEAWTTDFEVG